MSTVEMGRRGGKEPKRVKGAAAGLALFETFTSDDSAPFAIPPPLSQRATGPVSTIRVSTIRVTAEATMACNCSIGLDSNNKNTSVFGAKNGDFLTFLVLLSGITSELNLERTSFPHHLHSVHLKNDYKPRLPCNNTQFASQIVLDKRRKTQIRRLHFDFWVPKKRSRALNFFT